MSTVPIIKGEGQLNIVSQTVPGQNNNELPPPYCEDDSDSDHDPEDEGRNPDIRLLINAEQVVRGSHNLVPINGAHILQAAKINTVLLNVINDINKSNCNPRRPLKVHVNLNCGVNVVGDRNVIGNFGVAPRLPPQRPDPATTTATAGTTTSATVGATTVATADTTTGAKRKADNDADENPTAKRVTTRAPSP